MSITAPCIVIDGVVSLHDCYEEERLDQGRVVQKNYYAYYDSVTDIFSNLVARFDYIYENGKLRETKCRTFNESEEVIFEERELFYVNSSRKVRIVEGKEVPL